MPQDIDVEYSLFNGSIRSINVQTGFNQNPSVITVDVVAEKNTSLTINLRDFINITIGAFNFNGIVQGWDNLETDIGGTGVYQVRITDTKPVLEASQVILGSAFQALNSSIAYDYGDNVISVTPEDSEQIIDGIIFSRVKQFVESSTIRYGNLNYTVKFDFSLLRRGLDNEYRIKNSVLSLVELISQIANDHALDWFVETTSARQINVKMFNRTNNSGITFNQLRALHSGEIITFKRGKENRDSVVKSVLIGGYKTFLIETQGSTWRPFWGFVKNPSFPQLSPEKCKLRFKEEETSTPNLSPIFPISLMENIINKDYDPKQYTEEEIQRIISYSNDFWGRKFYAKISPSTTIDANGKPWINPVSAAWWDQDEPPVCFDHDGQLKFETDDGRWVTFVQIPLPGERASNNVQYQLDDTIFYSPNTHVGPDQNTILSNARRVWIKASLEIAGSYFILTLSVPLRLKKITQTTETILDPDTNEETEVPSEVTKESRLLSIEKAWLAILDQRATYGPWSNRENSTGKTEVVIDTSLTPWNFGFHGIIDSEGVESMDKVANARIKTITDTTTDIDTLELHVANVPKINLGVPLNRTGIITSLSINFSDSGIRTVYKSNQFTNELSKNQKYYQDLIDKLRRKAAEQNDRVKPFEDELNTFKKELPEPSITSPKESRDIPKTAKRTLGRVYARSSDTTPHYNLTPMAWVSDAFGSLTLVRNPDVFGNYLGVVNMGEKQTAPGRLEIGTDVELNVFSSRAVQLPNGSGLILSYYIDVAAPKPHEFVATIEQSVSNSEPRYRVSPVENSVQQLQLLQSEILDLNDVLNIGEPVNFGGNIALGTEVTIRWNENPNGSFTPFIEQQLNLFKPL